MPAIDQAAARMPAPPAARRRPWPAVSLAALAFAAMQVPLILIALAFEWRGSWGAPEEHGPLLGDFLLYGSAISGPLAPQLVLVALALGARRAGRLGRLSAGAIGAVGLLVLFNAAMSGTSDPTWAPRAALVGAAVLFAAGGALLVATALSRVTRRS